MNWFQKLKQIQWLNYYIIGEQNDCFKHFLRNPFTGIKKALGIPNVNPHSIIDIRLGYIPVEKIPILPNGVKKTLGESWFKWNIGKYRIIDIRKSHPTCGLYYNGFATFLFSLTNKYYPWISFNVRPCKSHFFNFGAGFEGTSEWDKEVAEVGLKCRIGSYKSAIEWNPDVVPGGLEEGHL